MASKPAVMTPAQFEVACDSLKGYPHVVGIFGGNPTMSPHFEAICEILRSKFPQRQCGLWSNHPRGKGAICRQTFNPRVSNLNVHLDEEAYNEFITTWPETRTITNLKGMEADSRHGPPFVSRLDLGLSEDEIREGTATCEVNQKWSALIGVLQGVPRAYVCELMYAMDVVHEQDPAWPLTGMDVVPGWWRRPMRDFADQVRAHCGHCGMPLKGWGQLAINGEREQVSATHAPWFRPKDRNRPVELITDRSQILEGALPSAITYIENSGLPIIQ
jgi:hypothetical protein